MFSNTIRKQAEEVSSNFNYLDLQKSYYFDSACQTLRPNKVIDAEIDYYKNFNACGHRVKYDWGRKVDEKVSETRSSLLRLAGKNSGKYSVAFTLNTSIGICTVLHQLQTDAYSKIITSEIEHNSVFLNAITWANRNKKKKIVYTRDSDGSLSYKKEDLKNAIVLVNVTSNIDGRKLLNIEALCKDVHDSGGILLLDCAQAFGNDPNILKHIEFDAAFGSGHKMYAQSVGFIIIKNNLIKELDCFLLGGGTVEDVGLESYELVRDESELYSRLEPGLQNFAGIIGLGEAVKWKENFESNCKNANQYMVSLSYYMYEKLKGINNLNMLNTQQSSVFSIWSDKHDSHQLGTFLANKQIMCRTGYFCCHYYLKDVMKYPPLLRISLGLNNTTEQVDYLIENLTYIINKF